MPCLATAVSDTANSEPNSVGAGDYYTFTLTPVLGFKISLSTLTFQIAATNGVTANFFVRSSLDSFATTIGSPQSVTGTNTTTFSPKSISLSASQFQNITSAITFRIYIRDNDNGNPNRDWLDSVNLNGDFAVVPEPSTYAMMGLGAGLLGAALRFRRKRR